VNRDKTRRMSTSTDDLTKTDEWFRTKLHDTIH